MNDFRHALDTVADALTAMRDRGVKMGASAAALAELARAKPAAAPPKAEPQPAPLRRIAAEIAPAHPPAPRPDPADLAFTRLAPATGTKAERLAAMRPAVLACTKCPHLVTSRTQVVFGIGNPEAALMFVGEAPGADEDAQGEPFVGAAGQLLTKIIVAMGLTRDDVYIGNVLKCRPDTPSSSTGNRKPTTAEMRTCLPYLREQIEIIAPRVLVALGATAMEGLLGETAPMARLRGRWHDFAGTPLMATYHPAYLLRNQSLSEKRKVWEDILLVMERLALPISEKQRGFFQR